MPNSNPPTDTDDTTIPDDLHIGPHEVKAWTQLPAGPILRLVYDTGSELHRTQMVDGDDQPVTLATHPRDGTAAAQTYNQMVGPFTDQNGRPVFDPADTGDDETPATLGEVEL